jgi:membrane-bound lytic murein transglycosylase D
VLSVVEHFQRPRGRKIIANGLRRAGRYRELILSILKEEGLPQDLMYVAQAESGFQPHARSRARAVGLWQFLTWRAQEYGLQVDWWVDERRDPAKSTRAAARHLRDLYAQFQDWYLALAAYNCGPQTVERALRRAGQEADYWTLAERRLLPRETRSFVPIILAIALVAKNPESYDIQVEPEPPLRFERVKVDKPTDLRAIAEVIGVDVDTLREMNPQVLRGVTPPRRKDFELYVPVGTAETLAAALPQLPESQRVYWQRHQVRRGDTLSQIAARYRSSMEAIAQASGISLRATIYPGQVLVVPAGGSNVREGGGATPRAQSRGEGTLTYTVQRGDTLSAIAARHGTSIAALAEANGISLHSILRPGDRLVIPENGRARAPRVSGAGGQVHRARWGDTLWNLSRRYGVSVGDLERANPFLSSRQLQAGDQLIIPE